jgi:molybdopterin molybdotransferase
VTETVFEAQWDEAREIVHSHAPKISTESVSVFELTGRVLAQDVLALSNMPPFAASRIDGWAVAGKQPWQVVGDINAGQISVTNLNPGECIHIATGAALPQGATACLKDEESVLQDGLVTAAFGAAELLVDESLPNLHDVRPSGYEAAEGELLVRRGTKISPGVAGVIAAAGYDEVLVYRKVTIDLIIFGDELVTSGPSRDGKVRDSLGPQLPAWLDYLGAKLLSTKHVEDTLTAHTKAIAESTADLIISTGGTAAGPVDHLHQAIIDCEGVLIIDAVLVRPGYHQLFAKFPDRFLIGLPGNPQSAVVGLMSLGTVFIEGCQQNPIPELPTFEVGTEIKAPARDMRMALCVNQQGRLFPVEHLDSSMLRGFVTADGFGLIPAGGVKPGETVRWLNLP